MSAAAYRHPARRAKKRAKSQLYESARMFNDAFDKVFCARRPHLRYLGTGAFDRVMNAKPLA